MNMKQKKVQSFKITNIRQLDHEGQVTETETPVTRQQLAKVLSETILGVDIEQFEDHWAGNPQIDINLFEEHDKPGQYRANVYKVETDEQGMTSQGDCIADFDIELFTDRNGDHILLECNGCGCIITNGELDTKLEGEGYFGGDISEDFWDRFQPGMIIPFGDHFHSEQEDLDCEHWDHHCGNFHEFDYSQLEPKITKPENIIEIPEPRAEPIKIRVEISGGILESAWVADAHANNIVIERWDWDNIRDAGTEHIAKEAWKLLPEMEIDVDPVVFEGHELSVEDITESAKDFGITLTDEQINQFKENNGL